MNGQACHRNQVWLVLTKDSALRLGDLIQGGSVAAREVEHAVVTVEVCGTGEHARKIAGDVK
jgi:hypothetical protein